MRTYDAWRVGPLSSCFFSFPPPSLPPPPLSLSIYPSFHLFIVPFIGFIHRFHSFVSFIYHLSFHPQLIHSDSSIDLRTDANAIHRTYQSLFSLSPLLHHNHSLLPHFIQHFFSDGCWKGEALKRPPFFLAP